MYHVGGKIFLEMVASLIILEEVWLHLLENGPSFSSKVYMRFVRKCCNVVLGFVSCAEEYGTTVSWQLCGKRCKMIPYHHKVFVPALA